MQDFGLASVLAVLIAAMVGFVVGYVTYDSVREGIRAPGANTSFENAQLISSRWMWYTTLVILVFLAIVGTIRLIVQEVRKTKGLPQTPKLENAFWINP